MKVCDRHSDRPAIDTVHTIVDDTYVDLCEECRTQVLAFFQGKEFPAKKESLLGKVFGK